MRFSVVALAACGLVAVSGLAADTLGSWQPLQNGSYKIFSGQTVAYGEAPTAQDRKLSMLVRGQAAKEIFDAIGPDMTETCSTAKGDRERQRGAVQCMFTAQKAATPEMGYRCWVGVDLIDGKGLPTVSC